MRKTLILLLFFISVVVNAATYYVSPSGSDAAAGTITAPWATWQYAFSKLAAGDILYVRGGTYTTSGTLSGGPYVGARISYKNGTSASPILISAYGSEVPVLDCSNVTHAGWKVALYVDGCSYIRFKGLTLKSMNEHGETTKPADGWVGLGSNHITLENCTVTRCGSGFMWGSGNDYISFINCDAYNNADLLFGAVSSGGPGGYCDGFGNHQLAPGSHVSYDGCRAWNNSDDGWDAMDSNGYITYTNCWSLNNGKTLGDWTNVSGDGDGFKIGITPGSKEAGQQRILKNCMAVGNKLSGFDESQDNSATADETLLNCTAYGNGRSGFGFYQTNGSGLATIKNCISYNNDLIGGYGQNVQLRGSCILSNNSWQIATVSDADFSSLVADAAKVARKADGSMPDVTLLHLASTSKLIDAGINVGLPYTGKAPDVGAFEAGSGTTAAAPVVVPVYVSSAVANTTPTLLEMTFNSSLTTIIPATSAFSVTVNTAAVTVTTVAISGTKVQLTLQNAIKVGDVVKVSYTKPSANPLQSSSGGQVASILTQAVANNLTATPTKDALVTVTMTITPTHIHKTMSVALAYSTTVATQLATIAPEILRIFDLNGKLYLEKSLKTGVTNFWMPLNLASGVYKVSLIGGSKELSTKNVMVY